MKEYPNTQAPEFKPSFEPIAGLNKWPYDYELLKNKPKNQYFAMDVWSSSGATGDGTTRDLNLIGLNGDREVTYSQEIIVGLGSTTAKITKQSSIEPPNSNTFVVLPGQIVEVSASFNSSTQNLYVSNTGSKRYLKGTTLTLNSTNPDVTFINSWTTEMTIKFQFATSASDRPIFWFFFKIY